MGIGYWKIVIDWLKLEFFDAYNPYDNHLTSFCLKQHDWWATSSWSLLYYYCNCCLCLDGRPWAQEEECRWDQRRIAIAKWWLKVWFPFICITVKHCVIMSFVNNGGCLLHFSEFVPTNYTWQICQSVCYIWARCISVIFGVSGQCIIIVYFHKMYSY